jgi:NAD(P)-dependent dehydrogenase (short-subunit alcohol dehydrogenase family)
MLADAIVDDRIAPAAIVTGGSSGVGKAICELLTRDGYLVAVADRDEVGARAVADACGGVALAVDVADEASVAGMVARAFDALGGRLDALATAASIVDSTSQSDDEDVAAFQRVHAVHVLGTYLCIRESVKRMTVGARICALAPEFGNPANGLGADAPYAAANGAVIAIARHASRSLAPRGIAVNGVAPNPRQQPTLSVALHERAASQQKVAEAVAWLLSPRAAHINGEIITVRGALY